MRVGISGSVIGAAMLLAGVAQAQVAPVPQLAFDYVEQYSTAGGNFVRVRFDVANKAAFPAELFVASPDLPPCGKNANASRSWVDFFAEDGTRLYGFCALGSPAALGSLWFAYRQEDVPPARVYIELNDRRANSRVRSNLVELTPAALMAAAEAKAGTGERAKGFFIADEAITIARKRKQPVDDKWVQAALGMARATVRIP